MQATSILPANWQIPQLFRDRLGARVGRQRAMSSDGHLLLVLHRPPRHDEDERTARFFWRSPDGNWMCSDLGSGPKAMTRHLEEYADVIESYDRREEAADQAEDYFGVLNGLSPVVRAARHLHHALQEARQMYPEDRNIIDFRDRAYEIERTAELLYNGTRNSLDYSLARQAEDQARSSHAMSVSAHRLNLLAAFFFPIATLAAIFGANLEHGLEDLSPPLPFVALIVAGLVLGFGLRAFITLGGETRSRQLRKDPHDPWAR
jgi:hypothetical protein